MHDIEELTVTLTLDNDEEVECAILAIFEVQSQEYIALIPLSEDMEEEEEVESDIFLYRFRETDDGNPELSNIEDDDEYESVADALDEWFETHDPEVEHLTQ
ncbi:MAG: DUF1292 domain-containing protein [Lachnospiraceae bacterium]|nr:DUF1292 domain-containing protein [Lachnospiraceae bacterium]